MGDPIRLQIADDLRRSRLAVFFRLLLAIPHFFWLGLWSFAALLAAVANFLATLVAGRAPLFFHRFLSAYVRYTTHLIAYVVLAANPFPGFTGEPGSYPIDVEIDPPERQNRWITGFRLILALPALLLAHSLLGFGAAFGGTRFGLYGGVVATVALLGWFASLARAEMPRGLRDLAAFSLGYAAQLDGYLLLLTDRYPNSDPAAHVHDAAPPHPVALTSEVDLRRSRLTVFFRLLLAIPHFVWLLAWGIAAVFAIVANWFATLFSGRSPRPLYRFLSAYVRYQTHVYAFLSLVANPFPGFTGKPKSYPVHVEIGPPERQKRSVTGLRLLLGIPAFLVAGALSSVLDVVGLLGWFAALVTGRMPRGLHRLGSFVLRYSAQALAYGYLITDRYPYSGPSASAESSSSDSTQRMQATG